MRLAYGRRIQPECLVALSDVVSFAEHRRILEFWSASFNCAQMILILTKNKQMDVKSTKVHGKEKKEREKSKEGRQEK